MFRMAVMMCSILIFEGAAFRPVASPQNSVQIQVLWSSPTPLIAPTRSGPASAGAFNPAAIREGGKTILLYREQGPQSVTISSRLGSEPAVARESMAAAPTC